MSISNCPRCHEKVTLPLGGRAESRVRCPLCQEEFLLGEALDQMPPALVLLDPADQHAASAYAAPAYAASSANEFGSDDFGAAGYDDRAYGQAPSRSSAGTAVADDGDGFGLQPVEEDAASAFGSADSEEGFGSSAAAPSPVRSKPRKKKKAKNPVFEIAKVGIGGALGLLIANMILWWLPGKWQRDPFELAPKVAEYAPYLVPEKLQKKKGSGTSSKASEKQVASTPTPAPEAGKSGLGGLNFEVGNPEDVAAGKGNKNTQKKPANKPKAPPKKDDLEMLAEPVAGDPLDLPKPANSEPALPSLDPALPNTTTKPAADPFDLAPSDKPASEKPASEKPETPDTVKPAPPATPDRTGLKKIEKLADDAIPTAITGVTSASEAFAGAASATKEERRTLFVSLYGSIAKIGEAAAHLKAAESLSNPQIDAIVPAVLGLLRQPTIAKGIDGFSGQWLDDQARPHTGAVIVGVVKQIEPRGKLFSMQLELARDQRLVNVIFTETPEGNFSVGSKAVVLGMVVENPTEALVGYEGPKQMVLLDGVSFLAPSE